VTSLTLSSFQGTEETVRVVAMEKDFHVDCYMCEVRYVIKSIKSL
jgi:hypothetical protein